MAPVVFPPAPEEDVRHFMAHPWCARHLGAAGGAARVLGRPRNTAAAPGTEDALLVATLNTPGTISHMVLFYADPHARAPPPRPLVPEVRVLCSLGAMLGGYVGVSHGGAVMTVLDEVAGYVLRVNRGRDGAVIRADAEFMTVYINTRFLRAVPLPGTFLVTARLDRLEGRKAFVGAWIEDGNGVKLASAEALFALPKEKL